MDIRDIGQAELHNRRDFLEEKERQRQKDIIEGNA